MPLRTPGCFSITENDLCSPRHRMREGDAQSEKGPAIGQFPKFFTNATEEETSKQLGNKNDMR
eukprot:1161743-Pelagomonas_calceolata.AAC.14